MRTVYKCLHLGRNLPVHHDVPSLAFHSLSSYLKMPCYIVYSKGGRQYCWYKHHGVEVRLYLDTEFHTYHMDIQIDPSTTQEPLSNQMTSFSLGRKYRDDKRVLQLSYSVMNSVEQYNDVSMI